MLETDLVILGAGPAGMAAAIEAAKHGLSVVLLDEQKRAGGQIYRDVERVAPLRGEILGQDYLDGLKLTSGIVQNGITHIAGATIWQVGADGQVAFSVDGKGRQIKAKRVLLATGALERPMPVAGWTLPGVMTVGAGQILLKQSGLIPTKAVLIGSGPLIYVLAAQMVTAGTPPLALIETQTKRDFVQSLKHLGGALRGWRYLLKGLKLIFALRKAGVKRFTAANTLKIHGDDAVTAVTFNGAKGPQRIECETVLMHHGVVPNVQISQSMGLDHKWNTQQHCFVPCLDPWGESSEEGVFIAGDGAGIGGAKVAELSGRLAAVRICHQLGKITAPKCDDLARLLLKVKTQELAIRPFLDTSYPPFAEALLPDDDTIVCRCEEVTAGDIRHYASLGCQGPNQTKAFGRSGMGPCQGRYCGLTVSSLLAEESGKLMDDIGYYNIRAPIKPITLGELASIADE